jgi:hypothetical protein
MPGIATTNLDRVRRINDHAGPARPGRRYTSESLSPPNGGIVQAAGSDLSRPPDAIKEGTE